ncbi:MAG TPA: NAD(P)H-hydrate dehydratase [Polyangiaceae bacterium]|nr:NAD(P)H-hydrate dehydratase [Polyangiaceae bacterium]
MRPVLSRAQMRDFERHWIDRGVPSLVLMENAGRGAAHLIGLRLKPRVAESARRAPLRGSCVRCADEAALAGAPAVVLAGPGNNGGDGFVVARHLWQRGARVDVLVWGPEAGYRGDALVQLGAFRGVGGVTRPLDDSALERLLTERPLLIDALFGTGLARELGPELVRYVERLNAAELEVVALDLPTGLDADSGELRPVALRATHTVTFAHLKTGSLTTRGHEYGGTVTVSHIGVPAQLPAGLEPRAWLLEDEDLRGLLHSRPAVVHKGQAGRVTVIGGQPGMGGAPLLSGRAALRGGAGLCTLLGEEETCRQWEREVLELMVARAELDAPEPARELLTRSDALVLGPGLGRSPAARALLTLGLEAGKPSVLDADGLRLLAEMGAGVLAASGDPGRFVLTPHPGEAAALLGCTIDAIERDRFAALERLVERFGAVVVLKGSRTLIGAPGHGPLVSAWGAPAMATAGSGDVLAGVIAAQLADRTGTQRAAWEAAQLGVGLHGLAGEQWQKQNGDAGLLASELADAVPRVRAELLGAVGHAVGH